MQCSTRTRTQIISNDGHRASARAVHVVQLVSTADSRNERLCLLLTAPDSCHHIARMCLIQSSLMLQAFERNKHYPRIVVAQNRATKNIVAAASDQRNMVYVQVKYMYLDMYSIRRGYFLVDLCPHGL